VGGGGRVALARFMFTNRLVDCLRQRHGDRPVVAAGRVFLLSPLIEQGLRAALPPDTCLSLQQLHPHRSAAVAAALLST